MNIQKPKAIIFDWDNTLIDSWTVILDALNFTFLSFGKKPWSLNQAKKKVRKSLRDSFPELFGKNWEEAAEIFYKRFEDIHISNLKPMNGAQKMLSQLLEQNIFMGVVSNKNGTLLRKEVCHLGWEKYFRSLVGASDAIRDKPSTEPVNLALSNYKYKNDNNIWFVGDSDIDMECAIKSKLIPILLRKRLPETREFNNYPPEHHIVDCQALSNLIKKM